MIQIQKLQICEVLCWNAYMISITPVNKLTSAYQFDIVKENAISVEMSYGIVWGSITDNSRVKQHYCSLFKRQTVFFEAVPPKNTISERFVQDCIETMTEPQVDEVLRRAGQRKSRFAGVGFYF